MKANEMLVLVLPPIPTTGMTSADADALTTKTRDAMMNELIRLSHVTGTGNGIPLPRTTALEEEKEALKRRTKGSQEASAF